MFDHAAEGGAPRRGGTLQFLREMKIVGGSCAAAAVGRHDGGDMQFSFRRKLGYIGHEPL